MSFGVTAICSDALVEIYLALFHQLHDGRGHEGLGDRGHVEQVIGLHRFPTLGAPHPEGTRVHNLIPLRHGERESRYLEPLHDSFEVRVQCRGELLAGAVLFCAADSHAKAYESCGHSGS